VATGKTIKGLRRVRPSVAASYLALIERLPLRPIRSEAELEKATSIMNELLDRDKLDEGARDYLDVLGDLVERYEEEHYAMEPVSEQETLRFLIEQRGVTQAQTANMAGIAESTISAVLSGKRQLTRNQIEKLAAYFHVSPGLFLHSPGQDSL
jgi:HTH-type transcriptional regulator / antitoxin HigA